MYWKKYLSEANVPAISGWFLKIRPNSKYKEALEAIGLEDVYYYTSDKKFYHDSEGNKHNAKLTAISDDQLKELDKIRDEVEKDAKKNTTKLSGEIVGK